MKRHPQWRSGPLPDGEAELLWGLGLLRDLLEIFLVIKTAPHERVVNVPDLLDGPYHGAWPWDLDKK